MVPHVVRNVITKISIFFLFAEAASASSDSQETDRNFPSITSLSEHSFSTDSIQSSLNDQSSWYTDYKKNQSASGLFYSFGNRPFSRTQYDDHIATVRGMFNKSNIIKVFKEAH